MRSLINSMTLACVLLANSAHASSWSDWWWRSDQQGQQALNHGDAKRAAQLFDDPRRRAFAELKAGDFTDAAKRLTPFDDASSQYNRGNALAHSGDLQAALKAYDAALKHAPKNSSLQRDAQHNRDLVARQLQQQAQQSSSGQNNKQQNKTSNQQSAQGQGSGSSQSSAGSKQTQQDAATKSSDADRSQQQANAGQQNAQSSAQQSTAESSKQSNAHANTQANAQASSSSAQNETQQTQKDAQAALQSQASSSASSTGRSQNATAMAQAAQSSSATGKDQARAADDSLKPSSEQQLALEQWLRQVPDDPGGLLRRKFLIEHMIKQRQAQGDSND